MAKAKKVTKKPESVAAVEQAAASKPSVMIPIDRIRPSKFNPRSLFDEEELAELTASIRAVGVLQNLVVRPLRVKAGGKLDKFGVVELTGDYDLIAGERRWRAAQAAGLAELPCLVVDLNDVQTFELRLIENVQRSQLNPLEEAEGYRRLLDQPGYDVHALAKAIKKSTGYIYGLIRLNDLPEKAKEAVISGRLGKEVAKLIARIPDAKQREDAAKWAIRPATWHANPATLHEAREYVAKTCMTELKGAPFDVKDAELFPSAGACTTCPFRAGNRQEEYPDTRPDVCLNPPCYDRKVDLIQIRRVEGLRDEGKEVLSPAASKQIFKYGGDTVPFDAAYYDLEDCKYVGDKRHSFRQLVGKELADKIVYARSPSGEVHALVRKKDANAVLKEKGVQVESFGRYASTKSMTPKQRAEQKLQDKLAAGLESQLMALAQRNAETVAEGGRYPEELVKLLRTIAWATVEHAWADVARKVAKRRAAEPKTLVHVLAEEGDGKAGKKSVGETARDKAQALIADLDGPGLVGYLAEVHACRKAMFLHVAKAADWDKDGEVDEGDRAFWKALNIRPSKVVSDLETKLRKEMEQNLAEAKAKKGAKK